MKSRLLAVTALAPWPVRDGYTLRAGHLIKGLAEEWKITLVSPEADKKDNFDLPDDLHWITVLGTQGGFRLPWKEDRELVEHGVEDALRQGSYEATLLWGGTEFLSASILDLPPVVADRIDCGTLLAWRNLRNRSGLRQKLRGLRWLTEIFIYERRYLNRLPAVAVTGAADRRVLSRVSGNDQIHVIPNGVTIPADDDTSRERGRPSVIFTGTLSYRPNVEAARYFAREVWPDIRQQVPDARFIVAGRYPGPEVLELENLEGVDLHVDVPDMGEEISRAWVAVAPMKSGSGIKNKVLEAWAVGRPVVMTELATNGLTLDEHARKLVCDRPEQMQRTIVQLLETPDLRQQLGKAGRDLAKRAHTWRASASKLSELISNAARG